MLFLYNLKYFCEKYIYIYVAQVIFGGFGVITCFSVLQPGKLCMQFVCMFVCFYRCAEENLHFYFYFLDC